MLNHFQACVYIWKVKVHTSMRTTVVTSKMDATITPIKAEEYLIVSVVTCACYITFQQSYPNCLKQLS